MKPTVLLSCLLIGAGTLAFAHAGVKNAAVLARMEAMKSIGDATGTLGKMAKGSMAFDATAARAAAATIATEAGRTPALFKAQETDPKSEALPAIWERFDDFTAKSATLQTVAAGLSESINSLDDLRAGMGQLGAACKSCHADYRE